MSNLENALRAIIREELAAIVGGADKTTADVIPAKTAKPARAAAPAKTAEKGPSKKELADAVVALAKIPEGGRDSAVSILKKYKAENVTALAESDYAAVLKDVLAATKSFDTPTTATEPESLV